MTKPNENTFCPKDVQGRRDWLAENHQTLDSVWLIYYKSTSTQYNLSWSEAVDEALCFGWIDSLKKTVDEERFMQFFSKRKPSSTWSKINKEKVRLLIAENRMTDAGNRTIEIAKDNGNWTLLDQAEQLIVPDDLEAEFKKNKDAKVFYLSLSKSNRKSILIWILLAKRAETRQNRIGEVIKLASEGLIPKQFR